MSIQTIKSEPVIEVSVLAALRGLHPDRPLTVSEALRVAELQAARMLAASGIAEAPVPAEIIEALPRIAVEYSHSMPSSTSGASDWDSGRGSWVITLNPVEPDTRIRMTICHEYKHILDYSKPALLCQPTRRYYGRPGIEYVADYFAGCLLMPKRLVTRAFYSGVQRLDDLAMMFDVSLVAMTVRLRQLGLADAMGPRCTGAPALSRKRDTHEHEVPA